MVSARSFYSIISNMSATKLMWRLISLSFEVNMAFGDFLA